MDFIDLLASPLLQARVTRQRQHRPWPIPRSPWVMGQTWMNLLFAHWEVSPDVLSSLIPRTLKLDTHTGRAWIGITPFIVRNLRVRLTWPVPNLSTFPEINVRTYVTVDDRPGIYFFSLDADSALAVAAAPRLYRLPYFRTAATVDADGSTIGYTCERRSADAPAPASFRARYQPVGPVARAVPDTLEHWLTERYCLYTVDEDLHPLRAEIHHPPWPLQPARAEIDNNTMTAELGISLAGDPLLHYARRQDVVFWPLRPA